MNNFPLMWELYRAQVGALEDFSWATLRRCREAYTKSLKESGGKKKKRRSGGKKRKVESLKDKRKRMKPMLDRCEKAMKNPEKGDELMKSFEEIIEFCKSL